ncbi:MAG: universal stress protein [Planctomycetes bacterium]|nr:universal stress protein [Planctomycetota bacterium]
MIAIQKILIATDFSDHSRIALRYAAEFARVFDSQVLICNVVEASGILSQLPPGGESYFPPNLPEVHRRQSEELCAKLQAEFPAGKSEVRVVVGKPFAEIVRMAREEDVDLIVLGTHGRGAIGHMLLGSVAERVVRKAPCPVLTVREGEHEFIMP